MSQCSIINIEGNHPTIPTQLNGNVGVAVAVDNILQIFGAASPAGSIPVETIGAGNTITVYVQTSEAISSSDASHIGLAAFNSNSFTVDTNGFVSLITPLSVSVGGTGDINFQPYSLITGGIIPSGALQTVAGVGTLGQILVSQGNNALPSWGNVASAGAVTLLQTDAGVSPVGPNTSGIIRVLGQSTPSTSGIKTTGSLNELDIAMFSPFAGDFSFSGANSGGYRFLSISNSSNTALSHAALFITVGGSSAGNPTVSYSIPPNVQNWSHGIAQADSNKFKICSATTLASNDRFSITTAGVITFNSAYSFPSADGSLGQTLITDGAGNLTFQDASKYLAYTNVTTTPYVVLTTDDFLSVNSGIAISINLPNTTTTGRQFTVKDRTGTAASNNITVTTVGGTVLLDGASVFVISVNYGAATFTFGGTNYEVT